MGGYLTLTNMNMTSITKPASSQQVTPRTSDLAKFDSKLDISQTNSVSAKIVGPFSDRHQVAVNNVQDDSVQDVTDNSEANPADQTTNQISMSKRDSMSSAVNPRLS